MFRTRSTKLERIDTGDYTPEEYAVFMREIAFINKYLGDGRALKKTLLNDLENDWQKPEHEEPFSVLDVGCGSGQLLRYVAEFARRHDKKVELVGLDLNEMSIYATAFDSRAFPEVSAIRGDAFHLPFADNSFDYAFSSLFFHHLNDEQIPAVLSEMNRVTRRGIYVIDLHRHRLAYVSYKLFCLVFRISPLVRDDGSLSLLRGFTPNELHSFDTSSSTKVSAHRSFPFRLILVVAPKM